jgi:hypothetical protein
LKYGENLSGGKEPLTAKIAKKIREGREESLCLPIKNPERFLAAFLGGFRG